MSDYQHPPNALPLKYRLQGQEHEPKYTLEYVLGSGGFGITYLGLGDREKKFVAVKEYLPHYASRTSNHKVVSRDSNDFQWGLDRLLTEAQTLARFDHHNIITVCGYLEANDTAYIVMEYAEGDTLSDYLKIKNTLNENELNEILHPLLDGLEEVHKADLLHRDIKPSNIILRDPDGSPVLLDFGAARQAIEEKSRLFSQEVLTPGYSPIEQWGSNESQGPWTDLYALGAVCYQALTGEVPHSAVDRIRDDRLIPVSQRCAGQVSSRFLSAVDAALSVYGERRPQSVADWREMLAVGSGDNRVEKDAMECPRAGWREVLAVGSGGRSQGSRIKKAIVVLVVVLVLGSLGSLGRWYIFQDRTIINKIEKLKKYEEARDAAVDAGDPQPLQDFVDRNPNSPHVSQAVSVIQSWDE